jgi:hypothetical protein
MGPESLSLTRCRHSAAASDSAVRLRPCPVLAAYSACTGLGPSDSSPRPAAPFPFTEAPAHPESAPGLLGCRFSRVRCDRTRPFEEVCRVPRGRRRDSTGGVRCEG